MANNVNEEDQITTLLNLSSDQLAAQLVGMVAQDQRFLQIALRTEPPSMTPEQLEKAFAGLSAKDQLQRVIATFDKMFKEGEDALRQKICNDLNYCDRKGHDLIKLLRDVAALLVMAHVLVWHPLGLMVALTAAVWLYRNGYFDKLCKCPPK
jgi:hypothetical protein